jgi:hypothetical protein
MEVDTSSAGLRLMKPFSRRWFSAGYSGVTLTFENGALGTIDNSRKAYTDTISVRKCSVAKG